ncbi:MAG: hypothetical protein H6Q70_124 [Firmicutes bacterium]|nr:hypothetical protein [Bacillota bacterium]
MELIDFSGYEQNDRMYGGLSGNKVGICYEDENYILKFPGNLKGREMKNIQLSYSNSPICEYLGSHIYQKLGIPTHDTLLGTRNGKIVVACKDFLRRGDRLNEFREIKTTYEPQFLDQNGDVTNGVGTDLNEIIDTMEKHPFLKGTPGVKERFWDMFVVDAYIGNSDRNNGNWGVIVRLDGKKELAPVYDNGGCLNNKWDDEKMDKILHDTAFLKAQAYNGVVCIFTLNDKKINPFQFIQKMEVSDCSLAVKRIVPRIEKCKLQIYRLIAATPVLSDIQKTFYRKMLNERLEKVLLPIYKKIVAKESYKQR